MDRYLQLRFRPLGIPYIGFRFKGVYGSLHWDSPMPSQPNLGWTHSKHANLQLEMMWDMFNSLGGVNEKRVFSIVPFFRSRR